MAVTRGTRFRDKRGRFRSTGGAFKTGAMFDPDSTLAIGLFNFQSKMEEAIENFAIEFAKDLEARAKQQAPWEDRTGDARSNLSSVVTFNAGDEIQISLSHGVDYGIWLEIRWAGKYAIIMPTIEQMAPELFHRMEGMMDRIIFYE